MKTFYFIAMIVIFLLSGNIIGQTLDTPPTPQGTVSVAGRAIEIKGGDTNDNHTLVYGQSVDMNNEESYFN